MPTASSPGKRARPATGLSSAGDPKRRKGNNNRIINYLIYVQKLEKGPLCRREALGKNPEQENLPWLGVGFFSNQGKGVISKTYILLSSFRKPHVYYEAKSELSIFIYNLLWWTILISISVALVNMLPVGIFDGGRFFYLTVLSLTKSEKIAKKVFSLGTYLFLFLILALMVFWAISFF